MASVRTEPLRSNQNGIQLYASPRTVRSSGDCLFYHTMDIPGHGRVIGDWDLTKDPEGYLGHEALRGLRILEVGPASGYLSFYMEQQGAHVVSVDVSPEFTFDVVPFGGIDRGALQTGFVKSQYKVQNGYWFAHARFNSQNRVHYGTGYNIPAGLGNFDIGVLACVLLHNANPIAMIEQVARRVTKKLIIVDLAHDQFGAAPTIMFFPTIENQAWHTWWRFSPAFFIAVLKVMGFSNCTTTTSIQFYQGTPITVHTVVAERVGGVDQSVFKSDAGQDRWIIDHVFQKALSSGYRGFFVEAGASDGISASNTYALERAYGWNGILVEPNRLFFEQLTNNRPGMTCLRAALAAQDGEMSFVEAGYYGAVLDHVRPIFERAGMAVDDNLNYRDNADGTPAQRVTVRARSLRSLLEEVGAPKMIDYLSLDVEASEFEVLKGFPFETHKIGGLTLECTYPSGGVLVDHEHREPCRQLLATHGYRRVGTIGVDDAYLPA